MLINKIHREERLQYKRKNLKQWRKFLKSSQK